MRLFSLMETAYESFDMSVKKYLTKALSAAGIRYNDSNIFAIIFTGVKGVLQNAMFYIEDAFTEQNIETAVRKKSIYSLARLSGYEAYYGAAATGVLTCLLKRNVSTQSGSSRIYIYDKSIVTNVNTGVNYVINLNSDSYIIDINKPLMSHQFKLIQGYYSTSIFSAKGFALETCEINLTGFFDKNFIQVFVNGELWSRAESLYDMSINSHEYMVKIGYDSTFEITFGNGVHGEVPYEGSIIEVVYLIHSGETGNTFINDGSIFEFVTRGVDTNGQSVDLNEYLKLYIDTCISGGQDPDSINDVRQMIGYNTRSTVLASEDNFKLFFRRFSFVGYTNIWTEPNSTCVNICCLSNKAQNIGYDEYLITDPKEYLLSEEHESMIKTTLTNSNKVFAGVNVNFITPIIRKYAVLVYLKLQSDFDKTNIENQITQYLISKFIGIRTGISNLYRSDFIKDISNLNSKIEFCDITFVSELAEQTFADGYYYKYQLQPVNGTYKFVSKKVMYEPQNNPGLDAFGNIQLDNMMEIPVLYGKFNYYYDKDNLDRNSLFKIEPIQFYYI